MNNNPFTSDMFIRIWSKHFDKNNTGIHFSFVKNLLFLKHKFLPIYFNYGKTHTKGIYYFVDHHCNLDLKGKVLLIYDVPTYFDINPEFKPNTLKLHKIRQYPGYLINLESFKDYSEYINGRFKGKSRNKLKRDKRRLENSFDIEYKIYYGDISKEEYDFIFGFFKMLLEKRFNEKGIYNNNLNPEEWDFYYEVAYPMIQDKKACLFVVKEKNNPICIMLNFLSHNSLYQFMMGFDIDYSKYNAGTTSIIKLLEWCGEKELNILDFSKGYYPFKKRWGNLEYRFEYHIIYDSRSIRSFCMAFCLKYFFTLKQSLREKNINEILHKFRFRSKNKKEINSQSYEFLDIDGTIEKESLKLIDFQSAEEQHLKPIVLDFLYYNAETLKNIKVYKILDKMSRYLIVGENKSNILQLR
ncbi:GNAT family N-acetyltransferase [Eudoraea sp.]|uniref:GNAT family N-acetyltransferase n=1 Tax=Eudoraea sp. TaxID=1979955 RepID=UPI003C741D4A